jgi:hypothetical protein
VIIVRWADDFIVGFEHREDAERFLAGLRGRFAKFGLELHPDKTRLIEFGRHAARNRAARGEGKPETFDFLGFTHICARSRSGRFWIRRITISKRMRAKLKMVKDQIRRRRHLPIPDQGRWLASVVRGHMAYYAVPGNYEAVNAFRTQVTRHWRKTLRRRSQKSRLTWARMNRIVTQWLPSTRILHPFPEARFAATHPRQEPSAVIPHAGICAGSRPQGRSLPRHNLSANKTPPIRAWAKKHKVRLCFTPVNASWANPIEAQFGPLRTFVMGGSDHPNHSVLTRRLQAYLAWRNANARHPDVLAA